VGFIFVVYQIKRRLSSLSAEAIICEKHNSIRQACFSGALVIALCFYALNIELTKL